MDKIIKILPTALIITPYFFIHKQINDQFNYLQYQQEEIKMIRKFRKKN
jgi:hypothetical protein